MAVKITKRSDIMRLAQQGKLAGTVLFIFEYHYGGHPTEDLFLAETRADAAKFLKLWRKARRAVHADCPYRNCNHVLGANYPMYSLRWFAARPFIRVWVNARYYEYSRSNVRIRARYCSECNSRTGLLAPC